MPDMELEEKIKSMFSSVMSRVSGTISPEETRMVDAFANYIQSKFETMSNETGASVDELMGKLKATSKNIKELGKVAKEAGLPFNVTKKNFQAMTKVVGIHFNSTIKIANEGLKRYNQTVKTASQIRADTLKDELNALKKLADMGKNYTKEIKVLTKLREQQLGQARMEQVQQGFLGKVVGIAGKVGIPGAGAIGGIMGAGTMAGAAAGGIAALIGAFKKLSSTLADMNKNVLGLSDVVASSGQDLEKVRQTNKENYKAMYKYIAKFGEEGEAAAELLPVAMESGLKTTMRYVEKTKKYTTDEIKAKEEDVRQSMVYYASMRHGAGLAHEQIKGLGSYLGTEWNATLQDMMPTVASVYKRLGNVNVGMKTFFKANIELSKSLNTTQLSFEDIGDELERSERMGHGWARAQARTRELITGPREANRGMQAFIAQQLGMGTGLAGAGRVFLSRQAGMGRSVVEKMFEKMGGEKGGFLKFKGTAEETRGKTGQATDAQIEMAEKISMMVKDAGISRATVYEQLGIMDKQEDIQKNTFELSQKEYKAALEIVANTEEAAKQMSGLGKLWKEATIGVWRYRMKDLFSGKQLGGGVGGGLPLGAPVMERLEAGEFVANQEATRKFGPQLQAMNMGIAPSGDGGGTQTIRIILETPMGEILKEVNAEIGDDMSIVEGQ